MENLRARTADLDPFDAGPYARLQTAVRLARPGVLEVRRRALVLAATAWVPLLVLAAAQGLALASTPRESLLLDLSAYARYLVAIPLLVIAEAMCFPRLAAVMRGFVTTGLIADTDRPRYDALVRSTRSLLADQRVELLLVAVTYIAAVSSANVVYPATVSTWAAPITDGVRALSYAGWWRLLVSQPLFLLLVAAWLWRLVLWARFLWGVSRLDLRIIPAHPDRAGGLHFLTTSLRGFLVLAFALSAAAAGGIGQAILIDGNPAVDFKFPVVGLVVVAMILFVGPLLVFSRPLARAKTQGVLVYGELADAVGRRFEGRWLRRRDIDDAALSVQDFSATTDLFSIVANVYGMRLVPVDRQILIRLLTATLLPFVPIILAILPLKDLLMRLGKLVL